MSARARWGVIALGVALSLFVVYTTVLGEFPPLQQRAVPLGLASVLAFLVYPASRSRPSAPWAIAVDALMITSAVVCAGYVVHQHEELALRMGAYTQADAVVASIGIVTVIEMARRTLGWGMTLVALGALSYVSLGPYLPGELGHRGFSFVSAAVYLYLSQEGVFGVTLEVMVSLIYIFILLGAFLESSGTGDLIITIANAITSRVTGGPGLSAVVASALFGTLSGSAVANVTSTGTYTIPLMKRVGYRPEFAGAVEAVASAGGAIMPPVMGAAAFLIAQNLGISYGEVALRAVVPALMYYATLGAVVYLRAKRLDLRPAPVESEPVSVLLRRKGHLFIPLAVLIGLLVSNFSPSYAAVGALGVLLVLTGLVPGPAGRMGPRGWVDGLVAGARQSISIFAVVSASGIVIGVASLTGIGVKFSMAMLHAAGQSLMLGLVFAMGGSMVLGMGLPPIGAYVLTVVVAGTSLSKLGADLFAVHLFVFYFASLAVITPPVAIAAYTAAGIAQADPFRTGWIASRLGLTGFIVPFMFVYGPPLLLRGSMPEIGLAIATALVGALALAVALEGYLVGPAAWWERVVLGAAALLLIKPGLGTDLVGMGLMSVVLVTHTIRARRLAAAV